MATLSLLVFVSSILNRNIFADGGWPCDSLPIATVCSGVLHQAFRSVSASVTLQWVLLTFLCLETCFKCHWVNKWKYCEWFTKKLHKTSKQPFFFPHKLWPYTKKYCYIVISVFLLVFAAFSTVTESFQCHFGEWNLLLTFVTTP